MSENSANSKRIAKNTLMLYFRMLIMMGVSLYTSRVVLVTLGVEDFGIYNVVGGVVGMFGFINGSMSAATQRYLSFELEKGDKRALRDTFNTSLFIHIVISLIIVILAETIGLWFLYNKMIIPAESFRAAVWVYQLSILSSIVLILSTPYNAVIIAHERMGAFAYVSILDVTLKLLLVYLLPIMGFNRLILYAVLILLSQLIIRMCYTWYCRQFEETKFKFVWNKTQFKDMAIFAWWTMNGNLAVIGYTQGLNVLLNMFFNPTVNAARAIAVQVQNATLNLCRNFQVSVNPQITKSYSREDYGYMHKLIYASSIYSFYFMLLLSMPIILNTEFILTLWLGIVPEYTVNFIRISLFIGLFTTLQSPLITSIHATGRLKKFQIYESSVLLLILPISYILLRFGMCPETVFIVHLFIVFIAQIIRVLIVCPLIYMPIFDYIKNVVFRCVMVVLFSFIFPIISYFHFPYGWYNFFITSFVCVVSVATCVYVWLPSTDKEFVLLKVRNFYKKLRL